MHTEQKSIEKENYIPFGDEWKKEMMKWRKEDLIDYLKKELTAAKEDKGVGMKWEAVNVNDELPPITDYYGVLKVGFPCPDKCEYDAEKKEFKKSYPAQKVTHWLRKLDESPSPSSADDSLAVGFAEWIIDKYEPTGKVTKWKSVNRVDGNYVFLNTSDLFAEYKKSPEFQPITSRDNRDEFGRRCFVAGANYYKDVGRMALANKTWDDYKQSPEFKSR